jgi:hypothetical protein
MIQFTSYCCAPQVRVEIPKWPMSGWKLGTWRELFDLPVNVSNGHRTLLTELVSRFHEGEANSVREVRTSGGVPAPFGASVRLEPAESDVDALEIHIQGHWKFYRGRLEAHRINGSYEFTQGDLKGRVASPWIDTRGSEPGPGWEHIQEPPDSLRGALLAVLYRSNVEQALIDTLGSKAFTDGVTAT